MDIKQLLGSKSENVEGNMLLEMISCLAVTAKVNPEDAADYFASNRKDSRQWLTRFTKRAAQNTFAEIKKTLDEEMPSPFRRKSKKGRKAKK